MITRCLSGWIGCAGRATASRIGVGLRFAGPQAQIGMPGYVRALSEDVAALRLQKRRGSRASVRKTLARPARHSSCKPRLGHICPLNHRQHVSRTARDLLQRSASRRGRTRRPKTHPAADCTGSLLKLPIGLERANRHFTDTPSARPNKKIIWATQLPPKHAAAATLAMAPRCSPASSRAPKSA